MDVDSQTFYKGIEQVPAGSAFELFLDGRHKTWSYWSLADIKPAEITSPSQVFKGLFDESVQLRMRSDVSVGVCLSGGLDSTSVLCSMMRAKASSTPIEAFSYVANEYDESRYIEDTVKYTGARLNRLFVNPVLLVANLEKVLWHHDEPVHNMNALVGFELMRLAAKTGVKVLLNGQGADETIGGYHSYFRVHWDRMLQRGEVSRAWNEHRQHASCFGLNPYTIFLNTVLSVLKIGISYHPIYRQVSAWKYRSTLDSRRWFTSELRRHIKTDDYPKIQSLEDYLKYSVLRQPLPLYLRIEDRNSMAHGVETRLPFLDYRLVTFLFRLSSEWKMKGPWNKYILRKSMAGNIPESVRTRSDKMGFPVPARQWVTTSLYHPLQDLLSSRETKEAGLYNVKNIRKDLEAQRHGGKDYTSALFNIAQFQLWSKLRHSDTARG
jgi:asparagine synthase (glutamine-hydrolysing)